MTTVERILRAYLRPYQRRFLEDGARRLIVLKARQIGFSTCLVLLALLTALSTRRHDVYLCSTSLRNAKELLRRVQKWIEVFQRAGLYLGVKRQTATIVEFGNGSRIQALPAKAVRSRSGTIILDEFGAYQHDREVWADVYPATESNPNLRIIIVSTPFGASGVFYDIWSNPDGIYDDWSRHQIDIYQAADEGFPVDPAEMETRYPSDIWRQEFCCQFLSDVDQYFSYELIRRSQYDPDELPDDGIQYGGVDLASEKAASVLAGLLDDSTQQWINLVETIKAAGQSRDYKDQISDIEAILDVHPFARVGVDATGEGKDLFQRLRSKYSSGAVKGISGGQWKTVYEDIPRMRLAMERDQLWLPNDAGIRNAFAKVEAKRTTNRRTTYSAREDGEGHADEFFASLLAFHVAREARQDANTPTPQSVGTLPNRGRISGRW